MDLALCAEAQRRGLGSILLRKPKSLAKLVHGIALASPIPISVKIRTGESQSKINAAEVNSLRYILPPAFGWKLRSVGGFGGAGGEGEGGGGDADI